MRLSTDRIIWATESRSYRQIVHGYDSVIKIVNSDKDLEGIGIFQREAAMYLSLRGLWGRYIPSLVFAGQIIMGRFLLVVTYEGTSLDHSHYRCLRRSA